MLISVVVTNLKSAMRNIYKCRKCGRYVEEPVHCGVKAEYFMSSRDRLALSKLMSYLLRHDPAAVGLKMSSEGWVSISELVRGIREVWVNKNKYRWVTEDHVRALASLDPKGRFEVRGGLIRARYGHSKTLGLKVVINYELDTTSEVLYHGTAEQNLQLILREGIKPMRRQYVHLTTNREIACETGARHGKAVVVAVNANCLRKSGIDILKASEVIRLVKYVPTKCIKKYFNC